MKKMLIGAFAGAFALCAQAEITTIPVADASLPTGTSFEIYNPGTVIDLAKDDDGGDNGSYWCTNGNSEVTFVVSNLTDYAAYNESCGRPAIAGTPNEKYVKIEADSRVYRTVQAGAVADENGDFTSVQQVSFDAAPLFFDSMVLFTATDEFKMPEYSQGDKLVVWLYGEEPNGEDESVATSTNLVITAGYLDAQGIPTPTNYVVSSESLAIEPNTWHRLTIKALRSNEFKIGGTEDALDAMISGFQVWVDGTEVSASAGSDQAISLFPSLVKSLQTDSDDTKSIAGVAFKGTGAVDDISFTATAPDFAQEQIVETFNYTVTLADGSDGEGADEAFDGLAYTIDGNTKTLVCDGATANKIPVFNGSMVLTVTLNDDAVKIADNEGWTASQDGLTYTKTVDISGYAADSSQSLTITFVMAGEPIDEGFAEDDKFGNVTLTAAQAEWLNGQGNYDALAAKIATMTQTALDNAYLLNLDITGDFSYEFGVSDFKVDTAAGKATVYVTLTRTGALAENEVAKPIIGTLKLTGTAEIGTAFAEIGLADLTFDANAGFGNGATTTAVIVDIGENGTDAKFYQPVIDAPAAASGN